MTHRMINFYAGPAGLPLPALERAQAELLDFAGTGMSVMEISHRAKEYDAVHEEDNMSAITQVLAGITDPSLQEIVAEFVQLLQQAGQDSSALAQETADRTTRWLAMEASGQLTQEEVATLLDAQKNEILIALDTIAIEERERLQPLLSRLLDIAISVLVKVI